MTRTWFVTGANRGFGRAVAEEALLRGDRVAATARTPAALDDLVARAPDRALPLALDIADRAAIGPAVAAAQEWGPGIDVLVNNAGHGLVGALEELADDDVDAVIGVNVVGTLAVTRAALAGMRARGSGHVVLLSSVGGVVAMPGHALYAISKFAVEGMGEALAGEVAPFGIRVTIVEPGPFRTGFAGAGSMGAAAAIPAYADTPAGRLRAGMAAQDGEQAGDPRRAAIAIADVVGTPDAPLRLPLGARAVDRIRTKLTAQLDDLAAGEATARWADAPAG